MRRLLSYVRGQPSAEEESESDEAESEEEEKEEQAPAQEQPCVPVVSEETSRDYRELWQLREEARVQFGAAKLRAALAQTTPSAAPSEPPVGAALPHATRADAPLDAPRVLQARRDKAPRSSGGAVGVPPQSPTLRNAPLSPVLGAHAADTSHRARAVRAVTPALSQSPEIWQDDESAPPDIWSAAWGPAEPLPPSGEERLRAAAEAEEQARLRRLEDEERRFAQALDEADAKRLLRLLRRYGVWEAMQAKLDEMEEVAAQADYPGAEAEAKAAAEERGLVILRSTLIRLAARATVRAGGTRTRDAAG